MCIYTVHFDDSDGYAMVAALHADNGVEIKEVDYEAQAEEVADTYEPSFSEADISLPEGTYIDDGELIVTDDAPDVVQDVLVEAGIAEEEMSRDITPGEGDVGGAGVEAVPFDDGNGGGGRNDYGGGNHYDGGVTPGNGDVGEGGMEAAPFDEGGNGGNGVNGANGANASATVDGPGDATLEYLKEHNARRKAYENYDALANYAPEILGEINPTAGKVVQLGADTYRICKGVLNNNWGSAIQGTLGVLKMFGLFKGNRQTGVSNEKILSEVQKVGLEVSDMHCLTKEMNKAVNLTLQQLYAQGIKSFDTSLTALNANAEIAQQMFTQATLLADARGIEVPGEDATAEEEFEFNRQLVQLIRDEVAKGGWEAAPFEGFEQIMGNVINEFVHVAGDVAQTAEFNPITCYDKYWHMYFNFDTQSYYLRQSYRSNIEYELKRAFGLIEIYRNIFSPSTRGTYTKYNDMFVAAIEQINNMPAGPSPQDLGSIQKYNMPWKTGVIVHCNTFDIDIYDIGYTYCGTGTNVPRDMLDEYIRRLHGRTVDEDLYLAGMIYKTNRFNFDPCGIGFNGKAEGKQFFYDVIRNPGYVLKHEYISSYGRENKYEYIRYYIRWFEVVKDN